MSRYNQEGELNIFIGRLVPETAIQGKEIRIKPFHFFFKKRILACLWEGSVDSQNHIYSFPFEKRGGSSTGSSMQHATRDGETQHPG